MPCIYLVDRVTYLVAFQFHNPRSYHQYHLSTQPHHRHNTYRTSIMQGGTHQQRGSRGRRQSRGQAAFGGRGRGHARGQHSPGVHPQGPLPQGPLAQGQQQQGYQNQPSPQPAYTPGQGEPPRSDPITDHIEVPKRRIDPADRGRQADFDRESENYSSLRPNLMLFINDIPSSNSQDHERRFTEAIHLGRLEGLSHNTFSVDTRNYTLLAPFQNHTHGHKIFLDNRSANFLDWIWKMKDEQELIIDTLGAQQQQERESPQRSPPRPVPATSRGAGGAMPMA